MANYLAPIINDQQEDANGDPLSGGTIEVYLAGTSTPATTYQTKAGTANTWPITLNTLGLNSAGAVWLTGGIAYKFIIKNSAGVTQRTIDNVSGINDSAVTNDQWLAYQGTPTYIGPNSFSLAGDQTQTFQVGCRLKTVNTGGTIYSTITGSAYSAPNTTVTVQSDSGILDSGLSQVSYGLISVLQTSLPGGLPTYGECRLRVTGGNIFIDPYKGNRITVNGRIYTLPSVGIGLAPTALTPGTLYFIYVFLSGSTLVAEASTTVHATDASTGVEIKSGDPTRTLVGMARPIAGPTFVDSATQRFAVNWFNPTPVYLRLALGSNVPTASLTPVGISGPVEFLTWAGRGYQFNVVGGSTNSSAAALNYTYLALNGTAPATAAAVGQAASAGGYMPACLGATLPFAADGYNAVYCVGQVTAGTGTWLAGLEITGQVLA